MCNGCLPPTPASSQLDPTSLAGLALPPAQGALRAVTRPWPPPHILPTMGKNLFSHNMHFLKNFMFWVIDFLYLQKKKFLADHF